MTKDEIEEMDKMLDNMTPSRYLADGMITSARGFERSVPATPVYEVLMPRDTVRALLSVARSLDSAREGLRAHWDHMGYNKDDRKFDAAPMEQRAMLMIDSLISEQDSMKELIERLLRTGVFDRDNACIECMDNEKLDFLCARHYALDVIKKKGTT